MEGLYFDLFENRENIIEQFGAPEDALEEANVLLAWYQYEDYSGDAFVLFEKGGKLFEVHGGHCSCSGLEGQWEPEETTWAALKMRELSDAKAQESLMEIVNKNIN